MTFSQVIAHIIFSVTLRKHTYSNILKILPPKNENFQIKLFYIFHISARNIDCGYSLELPRRCGSNEYPQSMFLSRNKKNNVYPCKPQFYYIKVGFKGVVFVMISTVCTVSSGTDRPEQNIHQTMLLYEESP